MDLEEQTARCGFYGGYMAGEDHTMNVNEKYVNNLARIAFTMAEGSCGRNVIPTEASVIGNMRVSHHQGFESSLKAVSELAAKYDIETEVLEPAIDSPLSDYNTEEFRLIVMFVDPVFRRFYGAIA